MKEMRKRKRSPSVFKAEVCDGFRMKSQCMNLNSNNGKDYMKRNEIQNGNMH